VKVLRGPRARCDRSMPVPCREPPNDPDRERPGIVLRTARPDDRDELVCLLDSCSRRSLGHRFLTGVGTPPPAGLIEHMLVPPTPIGRATVAVLDGHVVAHGMWASASAEPDDFAELGLLVRDDQQGLGIGSALVRVLHAQMVAQGIRRVEVNTGVDNRVIIEMIARRAPGSRPERDGPVATYRLPVDALHAA